MDKPVAAVINYNKPNLTLSTISDLCNNDPMVSSRKVRLVVIENGVSDSTQALLDTIKKLFPYVGFKTFKKRQSYAAACNWLYHKYPKSPYYFYLNNDLVITSPSLTELSNILALDPCVGIAVPLMNCHGMGQNINKIRDEYLPLLPVWTETSYDPRLKGDKPSHSGVLRMNHSLTSLVEAGDISSYRYHDAVAAFSFVGIRRQLLDDVGLQDETYPYGLGADDDLCLRAQRYGWKIATVMNTFVGHIGKASLSEQKGFMESRQQTIDMNQVRWPIPDEDTISVIIPAYNCGPWLWNCLRSLQRQTYENREIIVVDDGSTDETSKVLEYFNVIKLRNVTNQGANAARMKGYTVSRGRYIIFCDADAVYEPTFLEELHSDLSSAHNNIGYSYCNFRIGGEREGTHYSGRWDEHKMRSINFIDFPSLIRRDRFPGLDVTLPRLQDWDVWLTMMRGGYVGSYVNKTLYVSIKRPESISSRGLVDRVLMMARVKEKHGI